MERNPRRVITTTIGILFFIFILLFGYNRFERYINGPEMVLISLEQYQVIDNFSMVVTGTVKNTQSISINNRPLILNQDNSFTEMIVVSPGLTIIEIDMSDSFGKTKQYLYQIYSTGETTDYYSTYEETEQPIEEKELSEEAEIIN